MKKKQPEYTETCEDCRYCIDYHGYYCHKVQRGIPMSIAINDIPSWCPLEDYKEKHGVQEDNQDQFEMPEAFPI